MTASKSPSEGPSGPPATRFTEVLAAPGRVFALVVLALLMVMRITDPGIISTLRARVFDFEQQLAPRTYQPLPVRIVAVDEASLTRFGQWPWPRTLVAKLVRRIAAGNPRVMGVDIIFAEPDRFSPNRLAEI